jgi:hypothetical protein
MAGKMTRAALELSLDRRGQLERLAQPRTAARREVEPAGILLC